MTETHTPIAFALANALLGGAMHYKLLPHLWYTISSTADCDVDCSNGISIHLPANFQHFLFADMESIDVSGGATVTQNPPNFTPYSESRGEEWTADLRIGHAAADAVAAVCTLTLGDLAKGGTLTDSNGQSVELEAPHAYATGHVDIADATEAGTIAFGEHEAIEFEAQPAEKAIGYIENTYGRPEQDIGLYINGVHIIGSESGGDSVSAWAGFINDADCGVDAEVDSENESRINLTAQVAGAAGNNITLKVGEGMEYSAYEASGPTLTSGVDARTPQEVVDALNASEDCPAVATLAHVEAQDAKAVFTPLESYGPGQDYQLSIMENDAEVNSWTWQAQEGDGVQEIVAALNDDTGELWQNTRAVEASLEDGKVVLRRLVFHGAASNGYSVRLDINTPFVESEETPIEGGRDESDTITLTAKEYGVNDTIGVTGSLFSDEDGMSGGHGDYTVAELVTAISGEFSDITPAAGEAEGSITLTATTAGKAANAITYTATGCFGSGITRQGSTTRGKDAVEQTDYKIYLNGEEFSGGGAPVAPTPEPLGTTTTLLHGHVYTLAVAVDTDLSALGVELYGTAELWIDYTAGSVTWPTLWSWVDGIVPTFTAGTRYFVRVWSDGVAVIAKLEYSYTNV